MDDKRRYSRGWNINVRCAGWLGGVGGSGYLHISISSAQHRGWCVDARLQHARTRCLHAYFPRTYACANESWRKFSERRKCQCRGQIIRVKGNFALERCPFIHSRLFQFYFYLVISRSEITHFSANYQRKRRRRGDSCRQCWKIDALERVFEVYTTLLRTRFSFIKG